MPRLRVLEVAGKSNPKLRLLGVVGSGTIPTVPRLRLLGVVGAGPTAVIVSPLSAQIVEPESAVTVAASITSGESADSWVFRRVSGPSVGISGTGASRTFTAPSQDAPVNPTVPPQPSTVVIGVTATKDGVTSAERTCTVTIMPQTRWVWNGTKLVGAKST